jgi:hypothetical protein
MMLNGGCRPSKIKVKHIQGNNIMNINEILPLIESLPHDDKFRLMQFLVTKLAGEEGIFLKNGEKNTIKPVGKIYYSNKSDNSRRVKELLFAEKQKSIQNRQKEC